MYQSTKTYGHEVGLSCCFRQWRAQSHCRYLHGYALAIKLTFRAFELDERNWVVDFGGLKNFKGILEESFDHKCLVAEDDPAMETFVRLHAMGLIQMVIVPATGCEAFARMIFDVAQQRLLDAGYDERVSLVSVEVREHGANSALAFRQYGKD